MRDNSVKLQDFCDIEKFFTILDNWAKCTGLSAVVMDPDGRFISESFGMSPFCALIQHTEEGLARCQESWKSNLDGVHQCHAGFWDFVIPLVLPDGTLLGRVFAGQLFSSEQSVEEILEKVEPLLIEEKELREVLAQVPSKDSKEMEASYLLLKQMIEFFIEKSYSNWQSEKLRRFDVSMFLTALNTVYRMSIYFNITRNEYSLIDFNEGVTDVVPHGGKIDDLGNIVVQSIPDSEQAKEYYRRFNRQALIDSFSKGKKEISLRHQQMMYNGNIHWMEAKAVLIDTPQDDELHAICLTRIIDEEIEHQKLLEASLASVKQQKEMLTQALNNYKQADYDRRRDFLTGLRNRQDMFDLFNTTISGHSKKIYSMFMMDIDNFKALNDCYGHKAGDECLMAIGKALNEYGEAHGMYFYRYGGEEMLGIGFKKKDDAAVIANDLVNLVYELGIKRMDSPYGVVTVSVGYTTDNSRYEKMIDKADYAMYKAKDTGKNKAVCYDSL